MVGAKPDLIFCTNHSLAICTSNPGYFHCQGFAVRRVQGDAWFSHNHFLSHCYIMCSTNNLQRICGVYSQNVYGKLIRVGMLFGAEDFAYYKTLKPTLHFFIFIEVLYLEPD